MDVDLPSSIQAKLKSDTGEEAGGTLDIPLTVTKDQLQLICNALLEEASFAFCANFYNFFLNKRVINTIPYFTGGQAISVLCE